MNTFLRNFKKLFYVWNLLDNTPPTITCPNIRNYNTDPNENHAIIDLQAATANDNSGMPVKITTSHKFPLKVMASSRIAVIYTATDQTGNTKTCTVHFEVKGLTNFFINPALRWFWQRTLFCVIITSWNKLKFRSLIMKLLV